MRDRETSVVGRCMASAVGLLIWTGVALGQGQITTVSPDSAVQGATGLTVTFTLADGTPPPPPPDAPVESATIGGISGTLANPSDREPARMRFWNYQAGAGSDCDFFINSVTITTGSLIPNVSTPAYTVVDTGQTEAYDDDGNVIAPSPGEAFYGQDAHSDGVQPSFQNNGDGTITDLNTGLMWEQTPSSIGYSWQEASDYCDNLVLGGYDDWRMPNVKELQSIVDYSRSPTAIDPANVGPAIDPMFRCTAITNEAGNADYPYCWTGTSARFEAGEPFYYAWYVAFGMAVNTDGDDFHGAGAVRFDTKVEGGPAGEGGERYCNYIRLVRDADTSASRAPPDMPFTIVDTGQDNCYDTSSVIAAPVPGGAYYGQDAQYVGNPSSYTLSADGLTVYDNNTGLTWQQDPDIDDDGDIDADDKLTWTELQSYPAALNAGNFGGYSDWRLPSIKELYSLIDFRGTDPNPQSTDTAGLTPFIDTSAFAFAYGDTVAGERVIDSQYASSNLYVAGDLLFGVNFADGRIKGYGLTIFGRDKTFFVSCCRGNTDYGKNQFIDNGDGTITDHATGLIWQQGDSGSGMDWEDALAYAENLELAGRRDWRLPNVKELQGLLDYTRSPDTTASAAIDPLFSCTPISNMNGDTDYAFYWSGTTHLRFDGNGGRACYVSFGRGMGTYDEGATIEDVHGAGCQRSDPKTGDPADYPNSGNGPQGDVSRVFNHVRCVRAGAAEASIDTDGDGLTDAYEYNYGLHTTDMVAAEDDDGDGLSNEGERAAGTIPTDATSVLAFREVSSTITGRVDLVWSSELGRSYAIRQSTNLVKDAFTTTLATGMQATPPLNTYTAHLTGAPSFYRIDLE
ncbi:DUF1566 domain-containing protein [Verrucomicrobiota bacterium]